ncbi:MAG: hypothetical protein ACRC6B_07835, partial [Fusobacteriaceae bacterium]
MRIGKGYTLIGLIRCDLSYYLTDYKAIEKVVGKDEIEGIYVSDIQTTYIYKKDGAYISLPFTEESSEIEKENSIKVANTYENGFYVAKSIEDVSSGNKTKGQLAYEYYMNNPVNKRQASIKFGGVTLVNGYFKNNNVQGKEVAKPKSKGQLAYEYYMENDITQREASIKFGSRYLVWEYMSRHSLADKGSQLGEKNIQPVEIIIEKKFKSKSQSAYEYYMNNAINNRQASLKFGNCYLVRDYINSHKVPDKEVKPKTKGQLAYEYYMENNLSKKSASLKFGSMSLVCIHMKTNELPDKEIKYKNKTQQAYEYYVNNDVTKREASLRFGWCSLVSTYMLKNELPDKEKKPTPSFKDKLNQAIETQIINPMKVEGWSSRTDY